MRAVAVERYLGPGSSVLAYGAAVLLAGTAVGGIYVALPVARSLYAKGANLRVILTYLGASSVCRVPMAIFEASFLGWKFTLVRFSVSLPLLVLTSILLGRYLERRQYRMPD